MISDVDMFFNMESDNKKISKKVSLLSPFSKPIKIAGVANTKKRKNRIIFARILYSNKDQWPERKKNFR